MSAYSSRFERRRARGYPKQVAHHSSIAPPARDPDTGCVSHWNSAPGSSSEVHPQRSAPKRVAPPIRRDGVSHEQKQELEQELSSRRRLGEWDGCGTLRNVVQNAQEYRAKFTRLLEMERAKTKDESSYQRCMDALDTLVADKEVSGMKLIGHAVRCVILQADKDRATQNTLLQPSVRFEEGVRSFSTGHSEPLNTSQWAAAEAAYTQSVTLIVGPPGTGKSNVTDLLIRCLVKGHGCVLSRNQNHKLLVTGQSHLPVSELAVSLDRAGVCVLRAFAPENDTSKSLDLRTKKEIPSQLFEAKVICATLVGCTKAPLNTLYYPIQLIEEAGQATEPACLISIARGCRQLVLVGDPNQLPPHVDSPEADVGLLGVSMLQRLQLGGVPVHTLTVQYRSHPAISEYIRVSLYANALVNGPNVHNLPIPSFPWPHADRPVCVITVGDQDTAEDLETRAAAKEGGAKTSFANHEEALMVKAVVDAFHRGGASYPRIGVITPYGAQNLKLKSMIPSAVGQVEIGSVDAFQGKQKDIIIYSTVRCSVDQSVGHVADRRRLTVALSRARRGLVVISAKKHLGRGAGMTTLAPFFEWAEMNQYVMSSDAFLERTRSM